MTTTAIRLGRLGAPRRSAAPRSPMCGQCTTDLYLKYQLFQPVAGGRRPALGGLRGLLGRMLSTHRPSGGRVEYFCQKCGSWQRHHFPLGWEPRTVELTQGDVEDLHQVYVSPGEPLPSQEVMECLAESDRRRTAERSARQPVTAASQPTPA